jgi:hypothetical protein
LAVLQEAVESMFTSIELWILRDKQQQEPLDYLFIVSFFCFFYQDELSGMFIDFFEAGVDTVSSTISWIFLYLSKHPEIQEKCRQEIVNNLGKQVWNVKWTYDTFS